MIRYISDEFKDEVEKCIKYVEDFESHGGVYFDFRDIRCICEEENQDEEGDENLVIDENFIIDMEFDCDENKEITLRDFINLINKAKETDIQDRLMYMLDDKCVVRIGFNEIDGSYKIDSITDEESRIFKNSFKYKDLNIKCAIKKVDMLFSMIIAKTGDFDRYNPCCVSDDFFIEIISEGDGKLEKKEVEEICNSYIFEINATYKLGVMLSPRPEKFEDYYNEDKVEEEEEYKLRPLMFGRGMGNVITMFNEVDYINSNYDSSIQEYTKVIEYISQTVIRLEIIEEANKKLYSPKALNPDANYIKELEDMFLEHKNKYETDRNAIKTTIKKCCDISQLVGYAPKCLDKVNNFKKNISKPKAKVEEVKEAAYDSLCDVISDTRNSISHAKANYKETGKECPEDQKQQYIQMLRLICIQVIRWFYKVNESSRIV